MTLRKSIICLLASMVILSPLFLKIWTYIIFQFLWKLGRMSLLHNSCPLVFMSYECRFGVYGTFFLAFVIEI